MHRATTFVRLALVAASLAATLPSASAIERDISGSITGSIDVYDVYRGTGYA